MSEQPPPLPKREPGAVYVDGRLIGTPDPVEFADAARVTEAFQQALAEHAANPLEVTMVFHDPEFTAGLEALLKETGETLKEALDAAVTPIFDEVAAEFADPLAAPIPTEQETSDAEVP